MKRILCLSVLSALLAACTTTSKSPESGAGPGISAPRPKAAARAVAVGAGGHAAARAGRQAQARFLGRDARLEQRRPVAVLAVVHPQLPRADAAHQRQPGRAGPRHAARLAAGLRGRGRSGARAGGGDGGRAPLPANLSATLAAECRRRQAGHEHRHRLLRAAGARFAAAGRRLSMAAVHRAGGPADHRPGVGVSGTGRQARARQARRQARRALRHPRRHRGPRAAVRPCWCGWTIRWTTSFCRCRVRAACC